MTILGLTESFETMNQPGPTRPWRSLTAYFLESLKDRDVKFWHNLHSSLQFVLSKLRSISLIVWKPCTFCQFSYFGNFQQFFIIAFDWKRNFGFWWFPQKDIVRICQNIMNVKLKKYFFIYKNQFLGEKLKCLDFFAAFFRNTSKLQWFHKFRWLHRKKTHQNLSDYNQFLLKKWTEVNKK